MDCLKWCVWTPCERFKCTRRAPEYLEVISALLDGYRLGITRVSSRYEPHSVHRRVDSSLGRGARQAERGASGGGGTELLGCAERESGEEAGPLKQQRNKEERVGIRPS